MGGHNAGEVAARMAVDAVTDYVRVAILEGTARDDQMSWPFGFEPSLSRAGNLLRTAVLMAHVQILDAAMSVDQYSGMGTTIVVTLVSDGRLSVAHVGDSRLYLFGPRLRQLTRDDSWMASVLAADSRADRLLLATSPDPECADERGRRGGAHRRARDRGRASRRRPDRADDGRGSRRAGRQHASSSCWRRARSRPLRETWWRRRSPAAAATTARLWSPSTVRHVGSQYVCRWTEACTGRDPHAIFVRFC